MQRYLVLAAALLACTAASAQSDGADADPRFAEPEIRELEAPPEPAEAVCRDRIHTVREERGLPAIERDTTDPEEALLIAAVDHRIDGCSVIVMKYDSRDVRPIPKPDGGAPQLRRIQ